MSGWIEKFQKRLTDLQLQEQMHKTNAAAMDEERARLVMENVKQLTKSAEAQLEQHQLDLAKARVELEKARVEKATAEWIQKTLKDRSELDVDFLRIPKVSVGGN